MKKPLSLAWILGLALAATPFLSVKAQSEPKPPATPSPVASSDAAKGPDVSSALDNAAAKKPLPKDLKLSAWTTEVVKLAEAGIEDSVMLRFIDNSGTFTLGADQIIYLSDLGISSSVINAMLQHDQEVIAGVRTLTITSDPHYESLLSLLRDTNSTTAASAPSAPKTEPLATTPAPPATQPHPLSEVTAISAAPQTVAQMTPKSNPAVTATPAALVPSRPPAPLRRTSIACRRPKRRSFCRRSW